MNKETDIIYLKSLWYGNHLNKEELKRVKEVLRILNNELKLRKMKGGLKK